MLNRTISACLFTSFFSMPAIADVVDSEIEYRKLEQTSSGMHGALLEVGRVDVEDTSKPATKVSAGYEYFLDHDFSLQFKASYWDVAYTRTSSESIDVEVNDTAISGLAKVHFPAQQVSVVPYVGLGLSAHRLALSEVNDSGIDSVSKKETEFSDVEAEASVDFTAGIDYPVKDNLGANLNYSYARILNDRSKFDQATLSAGLTYKM